MARSASRPAHYGRHNGGDANQRAVPLRTEVLCSESRWAEALALVRPPAYCRDGVLAYLARRLGPEHLAQRIELPMRVFASEMHNSKTPHRRERGHVEEIAGLLDATQRTSWLLQLRLEYKAKKNFVRDLPEPLGTRDQHVETGRGQAKGSEKLLQLVFDQGTQALHPDHRELRGGVDVGPLPGPVTLYQVQQLLGLHWISWGFVVASIV